MVETSRYLSIICCELCICTSIETLVNLPVLDLVVLITAPTRSNASVTSSTLLLTVGTINLNKYCVVQTLLLSSSSLSLI